MRQLKGLDPIGGEPTEGMKSPVCGAFWVKYGLYSHYDGRITSCEPGSAIDRHSGRFLLSNSDLWH